MGARTPMQSEAFQRDGVLKLVPLTCTFSHRISRLGTRGEAHIYPKRILSMGFIDKSQVLDSRDGSSFYTSFNRFFLLDIIRYIVT